MLLLRATTDDLRITVGTTGSDIEVMISALIADSAAPPVLKGIPDIGPFASITTNVTDQILIDSSAISGIALGDSINVEQCSAYNNHASQGTTVEFNITDGTVNVRLAKCTLLPGEKLALGLDGQWLHFDANGALYPSTGNVANQTDMEAAAANDKYVSPLSFNWHPGSTKAWGKANGAGTSLLANWNISGIADTGTGRLGVTIGTDFSGVNYAIIPGIERGVTTLGVADVEQCALRNASQAAGTFEIESYDHTATTLVADDPANYHWQCNGDQ